MFDAIAWEASYTKPSRLFKEQRENPRGFFTSEEKFDNDGTHWTSYGFQAHGIHLELFIYWYMPKEEQ
jgi:hypothetical protein